MNPGFDWWCRWAGQGRAGQGKIAMITESVSWVFLDTTSMSTDTIHYFYYYDNVLLPVQQDVNA